MAFRLPSNLAVGRQYQVGSLGDVEVLENSLPPASRLLVALAFERRYEGFEADCERAEQELRKIEGLRTWPELDRFVTADEDQPVVWIHYLSSPAWWAWIAGILGGIFLLPIIAVFPFWIIEKLFPGFTEALVALMTMGLVAMIALPMVKSLSRPSEGRGG